MIVRRIFVAMVATITLNVRGLQTAQCRKTRHKVGHLTVKKRPSMPKPSDRNEDRGSGGGRRKRYSHGEGGTGNHPR